MAFTLTMQFSAGVILLYDLFLLFPFVLKKERIPKRFQTIVLIGFLAACAGILFSLLHLGNPLNALKTLSNLNKSWLSREILGVLIYTGLLLVVTILHFRYPSFVKTNKWILHLTSVSGVVLVFVMSRIYQMPSMPAWNSIFTPIGFYLAMFLFGSTFLLLLQLNKGSWASQKILAILIITIPVIQIGLLPVHMTWLGEAGLAARQSQSLLLNEYLPAFFLRFGFELMTAGLGFWAFFSIRSDTLKNRNLFIPSFLACITSVGALVIDRYLFYQQIVPIGNL